ncbi:MAG: hypothetical protein R3C62_07000 [Chloroflexota bacterium]
MGLLLYEQGEYEAARPL